MENPSSLPTILLAITTVASFLSNPFIYLLGKRKRNSEIASDNSQATKNYADARSLDLNAFLNATKTITEQDHLIHEMSIQRTKDEHDLISAGWKVLELEGKLKAANADIQLLKLKEAANPPFQ